MTQSVTRPAAQAVSTKNVFAAYEASIYPYRFAGRIRIEQLMGGTPSDKKVAEGWLKSKMGVTKEDALQEAVAEVMVARGVNENDAIEIINQRRHLNGFKKDEDGLYIEGRHLKAAIKEAASVARSADNLASRFGATNKGTLSFVAEHIIVVEDKLYLDRQECDEVIQSFPRNPITKQTGIQYTESCFNVDIEFTIATDWEFTDEEWAAIWVTGGNQGIGASRSQGYGRYKVTRWEQIGEGKAGSLASKVKAAKNTKATTKE